MHYIADFVKGILIGAGAILPGISSGVICVVFGIYEKLLNCVLNFFKNIKYNFRFLFPIALGSFVGIVLLGNLLKYIFYAYPLQTKSTFIGLILGCIPKLFKSVNEKHSFKSSYLIYILIPFCIGISLVFLESFLHKRSITVTEFSFMSLVFSGFIMSAGVIIPGVSSTLILMLLGVYDSYLVSVSSVYLPFLFPLAIGLFFGCILCMKFVKYLFDNLYIQTFYCIIGFTIGSIFVLFPIMSSVIEYIICILCISFGFLVGYLIET